MIGKLLHESRGRVSNQLFVDLSHGIWNGSAAIPGFAIFYAFGHSFLDELLPVVPECLFVVLLMGLVQCGAVRKVYVPEMIDCLVDFIVTQSLKLRELLPCHPGCFQVSQVEAIHGFSQEFTNRAFCFAFGHQVHQPGNFTCRFVL